MNYELAKKLKDAGFPLSAASMEDTNDSKRKSQIFPHGKDSVGREGIWLYPTLSELIEACGSRFGGLIQAIAGKYWRAFDGEIQTIDGNGSTPEEAVARLYLQLNKKS